MEREARGYRPIRDYAVIGDDQTAALVARDGSIDWLCLPRFDSGAVCCRLLDAERGGFFQVRPAARFDAERSYIGLTNLLATTFCTDSGRVRLIDCMPISLSTADSRQPRLLRYVEGLAGTVELVVELRPVFDYGHTSAMIALRQDGALAYTGQEWVWLVGLRDLVRSDSGSILGHIQVRPGDRRWIILAHGLGAPIEPAAQVSAAEAALARTRTYWERWAAACTYDGPHRPLVQRSALTLKLLTFEPTGALVAAPTTSLPEALGGVRNWDYRYTWLRDAAWIVDSLTSLGYQREALAFWQWVEARLQAHPGALRVLYRVDGGPPPQEEDLSTLEGYRQSRPVRLGNAAVSQIQLDLPGELVQALALCTVRVPEMRPLRPDLWKLAKGLVELAAAHWREPDRGLWEMRGQPRHFLSSKLFCWVALDCGLRLARGEQLSAPITRWRHAWAELRQTILAAGYDQSLGSFTQAFDRRALDASTLLFPIVGFLDASDPRMGATIAQIQTHLATQGLVYRYREDDGLPAQEATFTPCAFWLAETLGLAGRLEEAWEEFERVVAHANDVGLLSEEIDPASGELLGNFPQGLSHLALIRTVVRLTALSARD